MRTATFNLENLDLRPRGERAFTRHAAALKPLLDRASADVLCLQEVNAQKTDRHGPRTFLALDRLIAGSRYEAFHRADSAAAESGGPRDVHNLVVLSRWPIVAKRRIQHDLVPAWRWVPPKSGRSDPRAIEISWDRPILYCRIELPGGQLLHVLNLHLRASRAAPVPRGKGQEGWRSTAAWAEGFFLAAQKQIGQALEARLLVDEIFNSEPSARIAVCGDMNADQHEMPVRLLCADAGEIGVAALASRSLAAIEDRLPPARRYSVRHAGRPVLLDHLLASQSLAQSCTGMEIFNEDLADEAYAPRDSPGSLHAALVATFAVG
jgi:endonuclease/exonuclease/phosphatase family metal-dependent hydrolase